MKIGILTFPLINNYGGILQAFAMMKLIKSLGHEPVLVNLKYSHNFKIYTKYFIKKYILFFMKKYKSASLFKQNKNTKYFVDNYINPKTEPIYTTNELVKILNNSNFDACVVGSDQVFSSMSGIGFKDIYSLGFVDNIIKIAYAGSFGGDFFKGKNINLHSQNLKKFKAISVREQSGIEVCKKTFGVEAQHVLDPTMMIDKKEYEMLFENLPTKTKGKIFAYILDKNSDKNAMLKRFAKEQKLEIYEINDGNTAKNIISPIEWMKAIYDAKIVITDSFHGCVFSIIFNKPFFAFVNEMRGNARFESLFGMFELKDRIINSSDNINLKNEINYAKINKILSEKKEFSVNFIIENLRKN